MPTMQYLLDMFYKAGWFPDVLMLGGWLYAAILFLVFLYHFFAYIVALLGGRRK